jgi:hypothetical protein
VTVLVGELSLGLAQRALDGRQADIIYSDPPWGPGNLMYWRTMNGEKERPDWDRFLDTFCSVAQASLAPGGHLFVEMGLRWVDELASAMLTVGLPEQSRWRVLYGPAKSPLQNVLWYSGPGAPCDPTGMRGEPMTKHVMESVASPGALVFDPCCGKGMTARCSIRLGMRFAGCELNPQRAAVTSAWLERHRSGQGRT